MRMQKYIFLEQMIGWKLVHLETVSKLKSFSSTLVGGKPDCGMNHLDP